MNVSVKYYREIKIAEFNLGTPVFLRAKKHLNFYEWVKDKVCSQKTWVKLSAPDNGKNIEINVKIQDLFEEVYKINKHITLEQILALRIGRVISVNNLSLFFENAEKNLGEEEKPPAVVNDKLISSLRNNRGFISRSEKLLRILRADKNLETTLLSFNRKLEEMRKKFFQGCEGSEWEMAILEAILEITQEKKRKTYNRFLQFLEAKSGEIDGVVERIYGQSGLVIMPEYQAALHRITVLMGVSERRANKNF